MNTFNKYMNIGYGICGFIFLFGFVMNSWQIFRIGRILFVISCIGFGVLAIAYLIANPKRFKEYKYKDYYDFIGLLLGSFISYALIVWKDK
jgi:hypothetical protein